MGAAQLAAGQHVCPDAAQVGGVGAWGVVVVVQPLELTS